jgi:hypothetical protein
MAGRAVATMTVSIIEMKLLAIIEANASMKARDFFSVLGLISFRGIVEVSDCEDSSVVVEDWASSLSGELSSIFEIV